MAAPLVLFAVLLVWRDVAASAGGEPVRGLPAPSRSARCDAPSAASRTRSVDDYVAGAVTAGAATILGAAELMQREVPWQRRRAGAARRRAFAGRRTRLRARLAAPLAVRRSLRRRRRRLREPPRPRPCPSLPRALVASTSFVVVGVAWIVRRAPPRPPREPQEADRVLSPRATSPRIGATEVTVALGAVNLLFLAFVLVQLRFLFGGRGLVEQRVGLTYARVRAARLLRARRSWPSSCSRCSSASTPSLDGTRRQLRLVRGLAVTLSRSSASSWRRLCSGSGCTSSSSA